MHLLKTQLVWAEVAKHHPAAGGAEINSSYPPASHCVPFDRPARSSQEGGGNAGVDRNVQTGGVTEVSRAEHEDRVGDVLGEYLTLQQRSRGIVLAELLFRNPVDRGSLRTPATGEDAGATNHPIGIDAVHLHPVLP